MTLSAFTHIGIFKISGQAQKERSHKSITRDRKQGNICEGRVTDRKKDMNSTTSNWDFCFWYKRKIYDVAKTSNIELIIYMWKI